jgi:MoaA/NifB/PqqE/SkfB family radical SAM enzyme
MEFLFSGGEPTMYPYFSKFISFLKDNGCYISVITNGSRTIAWWLKNFQNLNKVVLTYHYEFANLEHVEELIQLLNNKLNIHVNFTMLPLKFNEIYEIVGLVSTRFPNISLSLKPLLVGFGDEMYPYKKEQIDVMENFKTTSSQYFDDFPTRGSMNKVYYDSYKERYLATDFILKKENHWKGWYCNIGLELLYIHYNGDVYNGICRQGGKLTNVFNLGHFALPSTAIKCAKDTCHCLTDIMTSKFKYL